MLLHLREFLAQVSKGENSSTSPFEATHRDIHATALNTNDQTPSGFAPVASRVYFVRHIAPLATGLRVKVIPASVAPPLATTAVAVRGDKMDAKTGPLWDLFAAACARGILPPGGGPAVTVAPVARDAAWASGRLVEALSVLRAPFGVRLCNCSLVSGDFARLSDTPDGLVRVAFVATFPGFFAGEPLFFGHRWVAAQGRPLLFGAALHQVVEQGEEVTGCATLLLGLGVTWPDLEAVPGGGGTRVYARRLERSRG